jgi:hypothetical protein
MKRDQSSSKPEAKYGNNWGFHFEWSGDNGAQCRKSCADSFDTLAKGPCGTLGDSHNTMASTGLFNAGYSTYKYSITAPNTIEATYKVASDAYQDSHETGYNIANGEDAIAKFCSNHNMLVSNPPTTDNHFYSDNEHADTSRAPQRSYSYVGSQIHIYAAFVDVGFGQHDPACAVDSDFIVGDYEGDCKRALSIAMNGCKWRHL